MKEHVIRIEPDGTVKTLWTDTIDLRAFGAPHVERASEVEFDNTRGGWTVLLSSTGLFLAHNGERFHQSEWPYLFASREAALAAEVSFLQGRLSGL